MKLKSALYSFLLVILTGVFSFTAKAQSCSLAATASSLESRCKATGSIIVNTINGSGNYNYTVTGPAYSSVTSSNIIGGLQPGVYRVKIKDITSGCIVQLDSIIVTGTYQDPRFILTATDVTCNGANNGTITVGGLQYGRGPFSYSIVAPSASNAGTTNSSGFFNNLSAGNYTVQLSDSCGGLQTRIITIGNNSWSITGTAVTKVGCDSADVNLTVTDNNGNTNASGTGFAGYLYGYIRGTGDTVWSPSPSFRISKGKARSASFAIKDPCGNINVSAWFENNQPTANPGVSINNKSCNSFSASISDQQNLTNPQYCIYDGSGLLLSCNTTGVFNGLAYGSYCIMTTDNCYDTSFSRCFTVVQPKPVIQGINISNMSCGSFTATVNSSNTTNGQYCLYDSTGAVIICNSTGIFNNLLFGNYCVHVQNDPACYDTLMVSCFTVTKPVPSVDNTVATTMGCNNFTANITGQNNLTNPQFCLFDSANNQITCNTNGQFNNLAYGSYCIRIKNDPACYDTTIIRCFTANKVPVAIGITTNPSCTIGATDVSITLTNGTAPYTVNIYNPSGALVSTTNTSNNTVYINGLPGLAGGASYKVVVAGSCGSTDSSSFTPSASSLTKTINANSKCPAGIWQNGSGDLLVNAVFSNGRVIPRIISKDGSSVNIAYTSRSGTNYTFSNLQPAVYIIQYWFRNCSGFVYDTFALKPYAFPSLSQSAIYQCNNNSFSVNSAASGGIAPFTYEIIGSTPALPAIIQGPQASPAFNINNGITYSVVRLRATDACGNATINDASILPLGNTVVSASSNCFYNNISLSVDSIPNASYTWYKKTNATDSTLISSNQTYSIPYLLPSDTGTYVSVVSVNSGCLTKVSSFAVTGACGGALLAVNGLSFEGSLEKDNVQLKWSTVKSFDANQFIVERSTDGINFKSIGSVNVSSNNNISSSAYLYSDVNAGAGRNYYRLRVIKTGNVSAYTNIVEITKKGMVSISVMPNPVIDAFTIRFQQSISANYNVSLVSAEGRVILNNNYATISGDVKTIQRPHAMAAGLYYLLIRNTSTSEKEVIKLYFK